MKVKVNVKVETEVKLCHFKFKHDNRVYSAMILKKSGFEMNEVLVYWYDGKRFGNTWYTKDEVKSRLESGIWEYISEIKE